MNKLQAGFKNHLKTQTGILSYLILVRLSPGLWALDSSISCDASEQLAKWMLDARIETHHHTASKIFKGLGFVKIEILFLFLSHEY